MSELKALQDRRLYWTHRNRSRRDRVVPIGGLVEALAGEAQQNQDDAAPYLTAISGIKDDYFRRHCRLGPVANGTLIICVDEPSLVVPMRMSWSGAVLHAVQASRDCSKVRRVIFEFGVGGTAFG